MEKLIRERKSIEPRIKRVAEAVKKLETEAAEETEVQTELEVLGEIWAAFCTVHKRVLDACDDEDKYADAVQNQCNFERAYIGLKNRLAKVLKAVQNRDRSQEERYPPQSEIINQLAQQQAKLLRMMAGRMAAGASASTAVADNAHDPIPLSDLKLPLMKLPPFAGNYLEWQSFIDLFKSMVDSNPSIKDSQKLYFLKTHLSGEAATLISHLKIEDANYAPALAKLKARYDKPLEIAHKHIERFLNQQAMTSPSAQALRSLHDFSNEIVRALQAMQREDRDTWLLFILIGKLDSETKQLWYQKVTDMEEAGITLKAFLAFIDSRSFALQAAQPTRQRTIAASKLPIKPQYKGATTLVATNTTSNCDVCAKSSHPLYQCGKFIHMSSEERLAVVSSHRLCRNCLRKHPGEPCKSGNCRKCGLLHHTILHFALTPQGRQTPSASNAVPSGGGSAAQSLISALDSTTEFDVSNVLLATVSINVLDKHGRPHTCRAVLDCASQISFISQIFCNELGLDLLEADMNLEGISSTPAHADKCVQIIVESRCTDYRTAVPCMVLNKITNTLPIKPANTDGWPIPGSITLADPLFHRPGKISVLLGIELFFQLLEPGKISLSSDDSLPTLQNTKLGDEEKRCEDHFYKHTVRDDDGKFIVRLPFLDSSSLLGDSRQIAEKRLSHIERKLQRNPHLKLEYHAFLREYLESGHMTLIENPPNDAIYLPHHCVVKESSSTTKYRVVYDAAAKTTSGLSLNDILMAGAVLQDSLVDILLRFRFPLIVFTGDIKQMYRMIKLADCYYLCIVWRWGNNEPVQAYRLNTVTYGTKSASYLATKCLQQLLESYRQQYPTAVEKAERGTYVDDVLLGADSEEEAVLLRQQVTKIFASGGFHLRKWASNSAAVLQDIPAEDIEMQLPIELNDTRTIKALGIHWQPCSDVFLFSSSTHKIFQPTKRTMLSQIASIFDPLGLLAPIVIKAKMVMQQL
ncbi:uncharacterized protein LOC129728988 [Wyeomyia smithii]|uniref:uncharacterized protein LOC129728988 n=1 Tax=Wyeomyia smithii TaxID=174621 RepID=UPI002467F807|nr:uncharacterized protein LOC129728988 [Wyeomyia smithii]